MRKNLTIIGIILALIAIIALAIAKTMVMRKKHVAIASDQEMYNKNKAAEIAHMVNRG